MLAFRLGDLDGALRRFNNYFTQRWGNATDAEMATHNALTAADATLGIGRKQLIR